MEIVATDLDLDEIEVDTDFVLEFDVDGRSPSQQIVSTVITVDKDHPSVSISDKVEGFYSSSLFQPDENSITYIMDGEQFTASDWDELPDASEIDIVKWEAPETVVEDFTFTVIITLVDSTTGATTVVTGDWVVAVYGSYTVWSDQLRSFVDARSSN